MFPTWLFVIACAGRAPVMHDALQEVIQRESGAIQIGWAIRYFVSLEVLAELVDPSDLDRCLERLELDGGRCQVDLDACRFAEVRAEPFLQSAERHRAQIVTFTHRCQPAPQGAWVWIDPGDPARQMRLSTDAAPDDTGSERHADSPPEK